jgi:triosephosphate isomerase
MQQPIIRTPFFSINTKSYIYGKEALDLAIVADALAEEYDIDVFFTCQLVDAPAIIKNTKNLIVTAQHMDGLYPGPGMGRVLPDALKEVGVRAVNLNHAENPMSFFDISLAQTRASELGLITFVCANSIVDCKMAAQLNPTIIVCEQSELIGSGVIGDEDYMKSTTRSIKEINNDVLIVQAAGISTGSDVRKVLELGSDGTGAASSIMLSKDRRALLSEMFEVINEFKLKKG